MTTLRRDQYIRYSRQLVLPEVQGEGQQRIFEARVLLVGMGGLGSPQALYLAGAGIGTIGLVDGDRVDLANLHRQIIYSTQDIGTPKVVSAASRIKALNPDTQVITHNERISSANALEILQGYDIVVDCTDNFPARYLLNDACVMLKKPLVHGAIYRFGGQATVFSPDRGTPCYRCIFPVPPPAGAVPSCSQAGVLGIVPGLIGLIQATEVFKLILGKGEPLLGRLLLCDLMDMSFQEVSVQRDPACPMCGTSPSIHELMDYEEFCGLGPVSAPEQEAAHVAPRRLNAVELAKRLHAGQRYVFLDVREQWEQQVYRGFPNAVLIPYSELESLWHTLLPFKDAEIVVYCLFGYKSSHACLFLQSRGFATVWDLQGGLEEWYLYREQSGNET